MLPIHRRNSFPMDQPYLRNLGPLLPQILKGFLHILLLYSILKYRNSYFFGYPLLGECIIQIAGAEWNRREQKARYNRTYNPEPLSNAQLEESKRTSTDCVAVIVGYRENPTVWRQCLTSYKDNYDNCTQAIFMGVDGDDFEDMKMVEVADEVFSQRPTKIHVLEPFGAVARRDLISLDEKQQKFPTNSEIDSDIVLSTLVKRATTILDERGVLRSESGSPHPICIYQPHVAKKDIMFTCFILAIAFARANDVDFIWSSDSDSWINKNTLKHAISSVYEDEKCGGCCTALKIHNGNESVMADMIDVTFEANISMTAGVLGAFDVVDCQCGPAALFRTDALQEILMPWYNQIILGKRPVVNEDRHLTTRLLISGRKVAFNPIAWVATDTPTTFAKWTAQQIRWARAPALETLSNPRLFLLRHPLLFVHAIRRFCVPLINFQIVFVYATTGKSSRFSSPKDFALRILLFSIYASIRYQPGFVVFFKRAVCQVLLQIPQAAYMVWACVTAFDDGWGTPMRSSPEKAKKKKWLDSIGSQTCTTLWLSLTVAAASRGVAVAMFPLYENMFTVFGMFLGMSFFSIIFMLDV